MEKIIGQKILPNQKGPVLHTCRAMALLGEGGKKETWLFVKVRPCRKEPFTFSREEIQNTPNREWI